MPASNQTRSLKAIAREIDTDWSQRGNGVSYTAAPYLRAMHSLDKITDSYYEDPGTHVVRYFLSNAGGWRGDVAKRVKAELKSML